MKQKQQRFIEFALELLNDEQIRRKIQDITNYKSHIHVESTSQEDEIDINSEKLRDKESQIKELQDRIEKYKVIHQEDVIKLEEINKSCEYYKQQYQLVNKNLEQMNQYSNQLKGELEQVQQELMYYKKNYTKVDKIYNQYQLLSPVTQADLRGIFKHSNFEDFMACGTQIDSIEGLWDYTKFKIMQEQTEDVKLLKSLVEYFMERYNATFSEPIFIKQKVSVGDSFDVEEYMKTSDSRSSGDIKEVCLIGYINTQTRKIVRKSLVRI